jgi:hypothetical protein
VSSYEVLSLLVGVATLGFLVKYVRETTTIARATVGQHEAVLRPVVIISPSSLRGRASMKQVFEQLDQEGESVAEISPDNPFCIMNIGTGPALDVVLEVWPGIQDKPMRYMLPPLGVSRDTAVAPLSGGTIRQCNRIRICYSGLNHLSYAAEYELEAGVVRTFREQRLPSSSQAVGA